MILYHGTNADFDKIEIVRTQLHKDFGQGFYLTDIREQAERMALRKTRMLGGAPVVQAYEFDDTSLLNLKVLRFETPDEEWARFILKNRDRSTKTPQHDYDIVIGPIADDGVAYLLGRYTEGTLELAELARLLEYKKLNRQFYFGTERAVALLRRIWNND